MPLLPEKYNVEITIEPSGDHPEAELTIKRNDIPRAHIMAPGFEIPAIAEMVKVLEKSLNRDTGTLDEDAGNG